MCGVTKVRNTETYEHSKSLLWYGHVRMVDNNRSMKKVIQWISMGIRIKDQPRKPWRDEVGSILKVRRKADTRKIGDWRVYLREGRPVPKTSFPIP